VEINNGQWYLRAMRCDDRVDDRPALADLGDTWAVCEPSTGELLAEITLDPKSSYMHSRARPGHEDAAAMAEDTVRLYASEILGLRVHT
jgi:hypothetical protein